MDGNKNQNNIKRENRKKRSLHRHQEYGQKWIRNINKTRKLEIQYPLEGKRNKVSIIFKSRMS